MAVHYHFGVIPLILVTERGPAVFAKKTLGSLPAFAGTKGRGNDDRCMAAAVRNNPISATRRVLMPATPPTL